MLNQWPFEFLCVVCGMVALMAETAFIYAVHFL